MGNVLETISEAPCDTKGMTAASGELRCTDAAGFLSSSPGEGTVATAGEKGDESIITGYLEVLPCDGWMRFKVTLDAIKCTVQEPVRSSLPLLLCHSF
jgi:hypothetical protein